MQAEERLSRVCSTSAAEQTFGAANDRQSRTYTVQEKRNKEEDLGVLIGCHAAVG
jgi:hypothetical protein